MFEGLATCFECCKEFPYNGDSEAPQPINYIQIGRNGHDNLVMLCNDCEAEHVVPFTDTDYSDD
jgi:hypothetical protein